VVREDAIVFMRDRIRAVGEASGKPVTLVCTGCLTNAAALFTVFPAVARDHIACVSIMGGAIGLGNMTPGAEWNIEVDPEAAKLVFDSSSRLAYRLLMVPLEVTHTILVTPDILKQLSAGQPPANRLFTGLLTFFRDSYLELFEMPDPPLHDPAAIAVLLAESLFQMRHVHVGIETTGLCVGRTVREQ
jgi:inosine-uridine nucleoside N-ribohydrolase